MEYTWSKEWGEASYTSKSGVASPSVCLSAEVWAQTANVYGLPIDTATYTFCDHQFTRLATEDESCFEERI
jgi:hypothetical protein